MQISKYQNVIDSRDVIDRIAELEGQDELYTEDEYRELKALLALQDQAEDYAADWRYGEVLIHDSYFVEYAQQLAEDVGAIESEARWPACHIDWDAAADALRMDYTAVNFDGETYWIR